MLAALYDKLLYLFKIKKLYSRDIDPVIHCLYQTGRYSIPNYIGEVMLARRARADDTNERTSLHSHEQEKVGVSLRPAAARPRLLVILQPPPAGLIS